jgi:hypothetical protein
MEVEVRCVAAELLLQNHVRRLFVVEENDHSEREFSISGILPNGIAFVSPMMSPLTPESR